MQNLRRLRQRIRSVTNTQKITRAMQMVAGAKLRRQQEELVSFSPFAQALAGITRRFLEAHPALQHPLLGKDPKDAPVGLVLVTSDTGLCGTYNERVMLAAEGFLAEHPSRVVAAIGKKGNRLVAQRGIPRAKEILDWGGRYNSQKAASLLAWMEEQFLEGNVSAWWVAAMEFISAMRFQPVVAQLLPIGDSPRGDTLEGRVSPSGTSPILIEPDRKTLADELLKRHLEGHFKQLLLSAFTAEHSARMIAMKNATDNAAEMIDQLTLVRNKARQAAITKELIEVVSGAEALR